MDHIFYADFYNLLREYREPTTRGDILIKQKLNLIVKHYKSCSVEEREFADEITREFSHIIALLKNQHRQELMELSQKCRASPLPVHVAAATQRFPSSPSPTVPFSAASASLR